MHIRLKQFFGSLTAVLLVTSMVQAQNVTRQPPVERLDATDVARIQCPENEVTFDGACRAENFFEGLTAPGFDFLFAVGCKDIVLNSEGSGCGSAVILTEENEDSGLRRTITLDRRSLGEVLKTRRQRVESTTQIIGEQRGGYAILRVTEQDVVALPGGGFDVSTTERYLSEKGILISVLANDLTYTLAPENSENRQDFDVTGRICSTQKLAIEPRPDEVPCTCLDGRCDEGAGETNTFFEEGVGRIRYCSRTSRYDEARDGILQAELDLELEQPLVLRDVPELRIQRGGQTEDGDLTCYQVNGMYDSGLVQAYNSGGSSTFSTSQCNVNVMQDHTLTNLTCNMAQQAAGGALGLIAGANSPLFNLGATGPTNVTMGGQPVSLGSVISSVSSGFSAGYATGINVTQTAVNMMNLDTCNDPSFHISGYAMDAQFCPQANNTTCEGTHTVSMKVTLHTGAVCDAEIDLECTSGTSSSAMSLTDPGCACVQTAERLDTSSCR